VIAKNEEAFIADCLDSARQFVDEIVVVDTGSSDRTREIAREHGARVEEFAWCDDFAAARNAAIDFATSEWILMLDADERLDPASGPLLRPLARQTPARVHALMPLIENRVISGVGVQSTAVGMPRIFPRRSSIRFTGAIHELIVFVPDPDRTVLARVPEIRIIHYGYDPSVVKLRSKDARNVALLKAEIERGSEEPRMLFHMLEQHVAIGRDAEAVEAFAQFERKAATAPLPFWVEAYSFYLVALTRLGDLSKLEAAEKEAAQRGMLGASSLAHLSEVYEQIGDLSRAIDYLSRVLNQRLPEGLRELEGLAEWQTRLKLAELYKRRDGRSDIGRQALDNAETVYAQFPRDRQSSVALEIAATAVRLDEVEAAATWAERALRNAPQTDLAQQQLLNLLLLIYSHDPNANVANPFAGIDRALASNDLQAMYDLAFGLPLTVAGAVRCVAVVERLRATGESEAALGLLNRTLDGPPVEQVYWQLIQTLTELRRYQDAQLAVEALRRLGQNQKLVA
jgi:glycosyltransferase involved in cell wall biosynthesis